MAEPLPAADRSPLRLRPWTMPVVLLGGLATVVALGRQGTGLSFVSYPAAQVAGVKNVHLYQGVPLCQACHPAGDAQLASEPSLCSECHPALAHRGHPLGAPQREPPAAEIHLPLGAGGVLVCHTCHDPHADMLTGHGLRGPDNPKRLCAQCHPPP